MSNIQEKIQQERQNAREVCKIDGSNSSVCAAAWDAVEELQAEASHQKQAQPVKSSFEKDRKIGLREYLENIYQKS